MTTLKTARLARSVEAALEILTRILGMFVVYLGFDYLLELVSASSGSQDLLVSMLLLPALYILKDSHNIIEPFTVRVEFHSDRISVFRGLAPRIKDTLEFRNSENIEVITSLLGHFLNYGTVRLYSPGGHVEIPYVYNPDKVVSDVEGARNGT